MAYDYDDSDGFFENKGKRKAKSRKASSKRRPAKASRSRAKRPARAKSHNGWTKKDGVWVKAGAGKAGKSRRAKTSSRKGASAGGTCRDDRGHYTSCAGGSRRKSPARKRAATKKGAKRAWPKKGTRKMGKAVAGVEARAHEDLIKAQRLVQSARYKIKNTAKAAGGRNSAEKVFGEIVKAIEKLITKV